MKTLQQLKPSFGPVYAAAMYPGLAAIAQRHGYALACHGSLARDLDLIAVPWADTVSKHLEVIKDITSHYAVRLIGECQIKNHGRCSYMLSCGFGDCSIDLSFTPSRGIVKEEE